MKKTTILDVVFDKPNTSTRVYPRDLIEKAIKLFINGPSESNLFIDYNPSSTEVSFANICGKIDKFRLLEDGHIALDYDLYDQLPGGVVVKNALDKGIEHVFRLIMSGQVDDDGNVQRLVIHKISFDIP